MAKRSQDSIQFSDRFTKLLTQTTGGSSTSRSSFSSIRKSPAPKKKHLIVKSSKKTGNSVENIKSRAIQGSKFRCDDEELYQDVVMSLENDRRKAEEANDYDRYDKLVCAEKRVEKEFKESQKTAFKVRINSEFAKRHEETQRELREYDLGRKKERMELIKGMQMRLANLKEIHNQEIIAYDYEWNSEEKIKKYNKSSTKLRELYMEVEKLRAAKRFDEIRYVQAQIKEQREREIDLSQHRYRADYQEGLILLRKKHEYELSTIQSANRDKLETFDAKVKSEHDLLESRMAKLERVDNVDARAEIEWKRKVSEGCFSSRSVAQSPTRSWHANYSTDILFIPVKRMQCQHSQSSLNYKSVV